MDWFFPALIKLSVRNHLRFEVDYYSPNISLKFGKLPVISQSENSLDYFFYLKF